MQASRRAYRCSGEPSHTGSNDPEQPFPKAKLKSVDKVQSCSGRRRSDPPPSGHRVGAIAGTSST
jgi:hypothetical protein